MTQIAPITFATRFRGFLPVVVDVETGGFNSHTDALLEIAAVFLEMRSDGTLARGETLRYHVVPFPGAKLAESVAWHQFRGQDLGLAWIRRQLKLTAAELAPPTPLPRAPYGGAAP